MSGPLRIGVIGAGVSGMAAAWLLQDDHQVTLFDRAPRLGGHVETVPVTALGPTVYAELGPRFFFDSAYPYFLSLLRLLEVPVRWSDATVSFTDARHGDTIVLPPQSARHIAALGLSPRLLRHTLSLRRLIHDQLDVARARDFSVTFQEHLARGKYPASFGPEFAYPFLAACWGAPLNRIASFPMYSLLKGMPPGKNAGFYEVALGMSSYVQTFGEALGKVELRLGAGVVRVEPGPGFRVDDERGQAHSFDRLIVATSSVDAARLLRGLPAVAELQKAVAAFGHFDTDIVIHGDRSFMPPDRRDWSHTNLFFQGDTAWMSDWQGIRENLPVFRTWLPKGRALPDPLYGRRKFQHLIMSPRNALRQRAIAAQQGKAGVWVTGMYAVDVDNHESALLSALAPASVLAPESVNLARLLRGVAPDAAHGLEVLPVPGQPSALGAHG